MLRDRQSIFGIAHDLYACRIQKHILQKTAAATAAAAASVCMADWQPPPQLPFAGAWAGLTYLGSSIRKPSLLLKSPMIQASMY